MNGFDSLGLAPQVSQALVSMGFEAPTGVQARAIPAVLAGKDLFIQSETGTGKTFAYAAPILSSIMEDDAGQGPLALVLCPTQELAVQVGGQIEKLAFAAGLKTGLAILLGGSPISRQESALKKKPHIVVGTPGRTFDLANMRLLRTGRIRYIVLDEADRLFSPEYKDQAESLLDMARPRASVILASATISARTRKLASPYMKAAESIDLNDEGVLSGSIEHWAFYVEHRKKIEFIRKLESAIRPRRCLVFASSSDRVRRVVERLDEWGLPADSIVSRQEKEHRRVALDRFAKGSLRYLVTTDLGARGLDIPSISHVISLDFPEDGSGYIHRAGRTGRAGETGVSIIAADGPELRRASQLAVARGFVFRTKWLEDGAVLEPPVEEFFSRVEQGEAEKDEYRHSRQGRQYDRRQSKPRRD